MAWEDACGIVKPIKNGTGYLVSADQMVTCRHVVGDDRDVTVKLRGKEIPAKVERTSADLDLALLRLSAPISGVQPLDFAATCPADTRWKTYGYPSIAQGLAIPMQGYVAKPDGTDSLGQSSVVLYADMVQGNAQTVSGFSGSPVVVNGLVVGNIKRIVDSPERKGWPLYGLLWATPSADILKFLGRAAVTAAARPEPAGVDPLAGVRRELESIISATGVYALWNSLQETGVVDEQLSIRAAEILVSKARPELAIEIVNSLPATLIAARRLRARIIGEMNQTEKSIELLEQLQAEGNLDSDSGGILAGRYRRMWSQSGGVDDAWRRKSAETYQRYWKASGDPYCGINVASLALQEGRAADCRRIAGRVLDKLDDLEKNKPLDYWALATRGEAHLLLGDVEAAKTAYGRAKAAAAGKDRDIAVMWQGAVADLKKLGLPPNQLDDVLRPRATAAFFGHSIDTPGRQPSRFPANLVGDVRDAIGDKIRQYRIGFGVCSACRGSDLLFLDELIKQNGRAFVVLTAPTQEFATTFIGPVWQPIFDDVVNSDRVEFRVLDPSPDAWLEVRQIVRAEVRRSAKAWGCDPLLLAVWDEKPNYVGESVQLWHNSGDPVDPILIGNFSSRPATAGG